MATSAAARTRSTPTRQGPSGHFREALVLLVLRVLTTSTSYMGVRAMAEEYESMEE